MRDRFITSRVIFLVAALAVFFVGCGGSSQPPTAAESTNASVSTNAQPTETKLVIDGAAYTRQNVEGITVLALLEDVTTAEKIALDIKEFSGGKFVNGIGDKNSDSGEGYWIYYVNGEPASVGVAEYTLHKGDQVEFKFE